MDQKPTLRGFKPAFGLPDPSPFVLKVLLYMRVHNIEFDLKPGDSRKTPHKKIPVLEHNGQIIPDSELILDYLEHTYSIVEQLNPEQHSIGQFIVRALDSNVYWSVVYSRWLTEKNAPIIKETFFGEIPSLVRKPLFAMVQKSVKRDLFGHGIGRMEPDSIYKLAKKDIDSLANLLGEKKYLFGDSITRYDCAAAAYVAQMLPTTIDTPHSEMVSAHPNLISLWQRFKDEYVG